jgi:hypothetical protein
MIRDALVWSVPALLAGAFVRLILLASQPFAYWGSDSSSYFWFAQRLLTEGAISLPAKRQLLYPIFLVPVAALPGATLVWLAWLQHALGLATVAVVGYCVRKIFVGWKLWIIPCTVLYSVLPVLVWYEHELLGEAVFAHALAWAFAGWLAWDARDRAPSAWIFFLVPFAICVLTKSAGRFFWPGIILGLIATRAWRYLRWPQWTAIAVVFVVSWVIGETSQGARLLYTSTFPLTVMHSPLHADLKEEIAELVTRKRTRLATYHLDDSEPKEFLRKGHRDASKYPLWRELSHDQKKLWKTARELALEGIQADPTAYTGIALRRAGASFDLATFKTQRFLPEYFPERFSDHYEKIAESPPLMRMLFGGDFSYEELARRMAPSRWQSSGMWLECLMADIAMAVTPLRALPDGGFHVTPTGWWMLVAALLSALPRFLPRLGIWVACVLGYAVAVHLLGSSNPRFVVPVWSVLIVAAALPAEVLMQSWLHLRKRHLLHTDIERTAPDRDIKNGKSH